MKIQQITISYEEKRSANFQTAGFGASVLVTLDEGESLAQVIAKVKPGLIKLVTETTMAEAQRLADEAPKR